MRNQLPNIDIRLQNSDIGEVFKNKINTLIDALNLNRSEFNAQLIAGLLATDEANRAKSEADRAQSVVENGDATSLISAIRTLTLGTNKTIKAAGDLGRYQNQYHYFDFGSDNSYHVHFRTSAPSYFFDKLIISGGGFKVDASNQTRLDSTGVFDNDQRVYSPVNKPSASVLTAILNAQNSPFSLTRAVYATSVAALNNTQTRLDSTGVFDNDQRVYSPVNKPSPASLGAAAKVHLHDQLTTTPRATDANALLADYRAKVVMCNSSAANLPSVSTNNANAILSISTHTGKYGHELAFMGNNRFYHRYATAGQYSAYSEVWTDRKLTETQTFQQRVTAQRLCAGHDSGIAGSVNASDWFYSTGSHGWYNVTYGGGIYMKDHDWVRVHKNKSFHVSSNSRFSAIYAYGGIESQSRFYCSNLTGEGGLVGVYNARPLKPQIIWTIGQSWCTHASHYGLGYKNGSEILGYNQHQIVLKQNGFIGTHFGLDGSAWFKNAVFAKSRKGAIKSRVLTLDDIQPESRTTLYNNTAGLDYGTIHLADDYRNYDELIVVGADNGRSNTITANIDVAAIKDNISRTNNAFLLLLGLEYWSVKPTANGRAFANNGEKLTIYKIIGVKRFKLLN